MRVSVFGLGYVGTVSCACFAHDGLEVIGVDVNSTKVAAINEGQSPIVEEQIGDLIRDGINTRRLRATTDVVEAVQNSDISIISVGTPSSANGRLSLQAVERVCEQIGEALRTKRDRHLVVARSTMLPGSVRTVVVSAIERSSGKRLGNGFGVCFNPEFLREGSSVKDHYNPPYTLIGSWDNADSQRTALLYAKVQGDVFHVSVETAEMVKYVCNTFHALKITFANEIGVLGQACGVDSRVVMELVCRDTKLNISPRYLAPGFAFGGSCLPKDVRALLYHAREKDVDLPMTRGILESNRSQIDRVIQMVAGFGSRKIGMLGLSFKSGTDDLRESPLVILAEALIGKGFDIRIFDAEVSLARLVGSNREYIDREIPHISALLVHALEPVVEHADVLIAGKHSADLSRLPELCRAGQTLLDLIGVPPAHVPHAIAYRGVAW